MILNYFRITINYDSLMFVFILYGMNYDGNRKIKILNDEKMTFLIVLRKFNKIFFICHKFGISQSFEVAIKFNHA